MWQRCWWEGEKFSPLVSCLSVYCNKDDISSPLERIYIENPTLLYNLGQNMVRNGCRKCGYWVVLHTCGCSILYNKYRTSQKKGLLGFVKPLCAFKSLWFYSIFLTDEKSEKSCPLIKNSIIGPIFAPTKLTSKILYSWQTLYVYKTAKPSAKTVSICHLKNTGTPQNIHSFINSSFHLFTTNTCI